MNAKAETDLHRWAQRGFAAAIERADPARAVTQALQANPLAPERGTTYVIALGKAAPAMLFAALPHLSKSEALCITHAGNTDPIPDGVAHFYASHPVPDEVGLKAGRAVIEMAERAGPDDQILALISGGGSALLPAPAAGISLAEKQALNAALLASGMDIMAMNLIRQQVSLLKGGGLSRLAAPAPVHALILSDVIGDDLRAIASGPTASPLGSAAEALSLCDRAGLALPPQLRAHLERGTPTSNNAPAGTNRLIGSNRDSAQAAADALRPEFAVALAADPLVGDVAQVAKRLAREARAMASTGPAARVWGGETTVQLRGSGTGGRNQELALRFAREMAHTPLPRDWVFLSGGTDGRDGPTDAAGGLIDNDTLHRLAAAGADLEQGLHNNDSYALLKATDDLLITGATGTNVADVQILLLGPER